MPTPDESERERFQKWRDRVGVKLVCPFCGGKDWSLPQAIAALVIDPVTRRTDTEEVAPFRPVQCDKCGYVALFSLTVSGGADDESDDD